MSVSPSLPFEPTSVRSSPGGLLAMWSCAPIAYTRVRGHFQHDYALQLIKHVESVANITPMVEQYHDWGDMVSYDVSSQRDLIAWTLRMRRHVKRLAILTHSPAVTLGVRVANAALAGFIKVYDDRAAFEAELVGRVHELTAASPKIG